jgi:hypothetical protein
MHDVENVETSAPSAAVRSVRAEFSTTSVVMPLIIWRRGNPLNHPALPGSSERKLRRRIAEDFSAKPTLVTNVR